MPKSDLRELVRKYPELRDQLGFIQSQVVQSLIFDGLRSGRLKIEGKNKLQSARAVIRFLRSVSKRTLICVDDKQEALLEKARECASKKEHEFAAIFLATYFEHWLNGLVLAACERKKLNEKIAHRLIRTVPFTEKSGVLFEELDMSRIPTALTAAICKVAKLRNEAIHYRWEGKSDLEKKKHIQDIREIVERGFLAVEDAKTYERNVFLKGIEELEKYSKEDMPIGLDESRPALLGFD